MIKLNEKNFNKVDELNNALKIKQELLCIISFKFFYKKSHK